MSTEERTLRFISDPGHGWLEVPIAEVVALGIHNDISPYSYHHDGMAYLEEDLDAGVYIKALAAAGREGPRFEEVYQESTPIRDYDLFRRPDVSTS